jgi:hypothetical protein
MKKIITIAIIFLFSANVFAETSKKWTDVSGWKDIKIYAEENGGTVEDLKDVTPNTMLAYWAGRMTEFYWDKKTNSVTKVRVRVTWSSDKGEPCGKIIILPLSDTKDFDFRSLAMREC